MLTKEYWDVLATIFDTDLYGLLNILLKDSYYDEDEKGISIVYTPGGNQEVLFLTKNGLKQDPIYGKLGKIQLNNGKWVAQFYYNDDALTVMEAVIG